MWIANVVAMRSTEVGDYVYRVSQPSLAMSRVPGVKVLTVGVLSPHLPEVLRQADVAILHLLNEDDLFPLVAERARRRQPTVYEISDNFVAPNAGVGIRDWFSNPVHRANAFALARSAAAVQVTGRGLEEAFGALNARTVVFENQIEVMGSPPRLPGGHGAVRLGWAGSTGHTEDLRQVSAVIAATCARFPGVTFAFMGNERQFHEVFANLAPDRKSFTRPGSLAAYRQFLGTLDIGIAPMIDNPYNRGRSDVKFLEYGSCGVAPVVAAVTPYRQHVVDGGNGFLFRDNDELARILERLIADPVLRTSIAGGAYQYVRTERREDQHAAARVDFYRSLLAPGAPQEDEDEDEEIERIPLAPLEGGDGAFNVVEHEAEARLIAGIEAEAREDRGLAREHFQHAMALLPAWSLPLFWMGRSHERRGDEPAAAYFQRAVEANPRSLRAHLHLARVQGRTDPDAALATLERATALVPGHAPPLEAMAEIHEARGRPDLAAVCHESALEANPFSSRAHHALAEYLFAKGDAVRAARHGIRAVELDGRNAAAAALLPRLIAALETRRK